MGKMLRVKSHRLPSLVTQNKHLLKWTAHFLSPKYEKSGETGHFSIFEIEKSDIVVSNFCWLLIFKSKSLYNVQGEILMILANSVDLFIQYTSRLKKKKLN